MIHQYNQAVHNENQPREFMIPHQSTLYQLEYVYILNWPPLFGDAGLVCPNYQSIPPGQNAVLRRFKHEC